MLVDNTYRIVLFGHRDFYGHRLLDSKLYPLLKTLIKTKQYVEIYIHRMPENHNLLIYVSTIYPFSYF